MTLHRFSSRFLAIAFCFLPAAAWAAGECRFPKKPPVTLKNMGPCHFDLDTLSFAGTPLEQARCLLTPVRTGGYLNERLETLPPAFEDYVGNAKDMPSRDALRHLLRERGLEAPSVPISKSPCRTGTTTIRSRAARLTLSSMTPRHPNFGNKAWPADIDADQGINRLARYACSNNIERAHTFINRSGEILYPHDFGKPWRATKFETATNFAHALRGLFIHNELIQPRKRHPKFRGRNDFKAPEPGFSAAQYDALALMYVVASARAGFWMIPAYHAVLDEGIYDKHDDPQNFDLNAFADSLDRLRAKLKAPPG